MHFGDRDFSKNGHRTILFKDYNVQQNRKGLSDLDIRKIEIVYGPECQKRDRQEKIKLCQNYPEVARKKRDIDFIINGSSLRINREITAPPEKTLTKDETNTLLELGIGKEVKEIMDRVYKVSSIALMNTRVKYCNDTKPNLRSNTNSNEKVADMLGIVKTVTKYVQSIVNDAIKNQKEFCEMYKSLDQYQRDSYRTTRSGSVQHLTQYRPTLFQWTKHHGKGVENQHDRIVYRTGNDTDKEVTKARSKRAIESVTKAVPSRGESDITWVRRKRAVNFTSEIEGINTNVQSDDIKVRNKRSAATEAVTKVIEPKGSTGNQSLNKKQEATDGVKLTNKDLTTAPNLNERTTVPKTSLKINDGKINMKSLGRRRFQDSPFRVYNRKKNNEEKDESALSLETKQEEMIAKQVKPIKKNYLSQNKKKPIKNW